MKAPKRAPPDEFLLAMALQEANARKLGPTMGEFFLDSKANSCRRDDPKLRWCCAAGALVLAGVGRLRSVGESVGDTCEAGVMRLPAPFNDAAIVHGNDDCHDDFTNDPADNGETLGHAFQLAMNGYGPGWYDHKVRAQ